MHRIAVAERVIAEDAVDSQAAIEPDFVERI